MNARSFAGGKIYFMIAQRFFSRFFLVFCAEIIGPVQKFSSEPCLGPKIFEKFKLPGFFGKISSAKRRIPRKEPIVEYFQLGQWQTIKVQDF
jgi:hypothetical protein